MIFTDIDYSGLRKELEIKKLKLEVAQLTTKTKDYPKEKEQKQIFMWAAIIELVLLVLALWLK